MHYTRDMRRLVTVLAAVAALLLAAPAGAVEFTQAGIAREQARLSSSPVGERIAYWAERFVGTPYDPDPLGAYVTRRAIVADDAVDCMYHTFRSVELALTDTPQQALQTALGIRFKSQGVLGTDGAVTNYDERFQYAIDMLRSGKWGRDITPGLRGAAEIEGSRGHEGVWMLPRDAVAPEAQAFKSGDIVYFVKEPDRRVVGEIIGHIGILSQEGASLYLIHASGIKRRGGLVKKVLFLDYVREMPFAGIIVGRI